MKKYKLTEESMVLDDRTVYRIQALITFDQVTKGDLGGWIESEENLSQTGNCWVGDEAKVVCGAKVEGDAWVLDRVKVGSNACISGNALLKGDVMVGENAVVTGSAKICDHGIVMGNAVVCGDVCIYGYAYITGQAKISDSSRVFGNAVVRDKGRVCGSAVVGGFCVVCGEGVVGEDMRLQNVAVVENDLTDKHNLQENLMAQCGLVACDGKVTCYKVVNGDLSSLYDPSFKYKVGEWAVCEHWDGSKRSCAPGLHFSSADYWISQYRTGYVIIIAEVNLDDIITIQKGKIRCKRAFIKGTAQLSRK